MPAKDKNWIRKPLRIAAKQSRINNEDIAETFERFTLGMHCNVEQLCHIFKANDPEDPDAFTGEFMEELHGDMLDEYIANAHKNGVKIICYILLHQLFEKDRRNHPEWLQLKKNGEPVLIYYCDYGGCPTSTWGTEFTIQRIADLCKHDIDGIFLDGPLFFNECCYCDSCKKKFKETYNKELVDATYAEFTQFRLDEITTFIANIRHTVDSVNPNIVLYLNNSALRNDILGSNTRRLAPYVDIIGAEGGFFPAGKSDSLYMCSAFAKDIEDKAEGMPTVIFTKAERSPSAFITHTAAETTRVFAQTVANGANIWYGIHGSIDNVDTEAGQAAKKFFEFLEQNEPYYTDTKSIADAAIMWSMPTANFYASSVSASDFTGDGKESNVEYRADHRSEYMGFVEMLEHEHILFDSIDDVSIETRLDSYPLVILPACGSMSESNKEALRKYVSNGGTVIASFDTGVFNEYCTEKDCKFFEELFGVKYQGALKHNDRRDYMHLVEDSFPGLEPILMVPNLTIALETTTATALGWLYEPCPGSYKELKQFTTPAITKNTYGKGQAILFAGNIGSQYETFKPQRMRRVVSRLINSAISKRFETNAPACVEATLREQEDAYILHIINNTVDGNRPIERNIPIYDLTFELNVGPITSIKALKDENVSFSPTSTGAHIELDKLVDYSVIVLYK